MLNSHVEKHLKMIDCLRLFFVPSFEFQTRNYVTCFGHICNRPHGHDNYTQKYINTVLITV